MDHSEKFSGIKWKVETLFIKWNCLCLLSALVYYDFPEVSSFFSRDVSRNFDLGYLWIKCKHKEEKSPKEIVL